MTPQDFADLQARARRVSVRALTPLNGYVFVPAGDRLTEEEVRALAVARASLDGLCGTCMARVA